MTTVVCEHLQLVPDQGLDVTARQLRHWAPLQIDQSHANLPC